jgi:serine/threonine protein kinase
MACPGENTIGAFLGGALTEAQVASVEAHLDGCADCRSLLRMTALAATRDDAGGPHRERAGPATLRPGACVGGYVVESVLGAGGMGVVYAATEPELRRRVALKVPNLPIQDGPSFLERFRIEARSMARISHHNVVTIYRFGELPEGGVFIAMELIEGATARGWMSPGRSPREIFGVFLQAAEGLAAAHRVGLVHRDFKPDNVLVGNDGRVCVTDFGIAWLSTLGAMDCGLALGSPAYMAPEQMIGDAVDERTDVFSYCVSLFEALCGTRPFAGETLAELTEAIRAGRVPREPLEPRAAPAIRDAILAGLSASPRQRPRLGELIELLRSASSAD